MLALLAWGVFFLLLVKLWRIGATPFQMRIVSCWERHVEILPSRVKMSYWRFGFLDVFANFITLDLHGSFVMLRTDNTAVIQAVRCSRASSPIIVQMAAKISLCCALLQLQPMIAQHVPGIFNELADRLSRLGPDDPAPFRLMSSQCLPAPQRAQEVKLDWWTRLISVKGLDPLANEVDGDWWRRPLDSCFKIFAKRS